MSDRDGTGFEDPERLCDAIAELVDALEDSDLLSDDKASEIRSDIYQAVEFQDLPDDESL